MPAHIKAELIGGVLAAQAAQEVIER